MSGGGGGGEVKAKLSFGYLVSFGWLEKAGKKSDFKL